MPTSFASGRWALGVCDMCGQVYKLRQLLKEVYNQRFTGFLVCSDCWDEDNPQLQLGRYPINDPQALQNPRPDINKVISRILWNWAPVGHPSTVAVGEIGNLTVNGVVV